MYKPITNDDLRFGIFSPIRFQIYVNIQWICPVIKSAFLSSDIDWQHRGYNNSIQHICIILKSTLHINIILYRIHNIKV